MIKATFNILFKNYKSIKLCKKNALIIVSTQIPIGTIKKLENYDKEN